MSGAQDDPHSDTASYMCLDCGARFTTAADPIDRRFRIHERLVVETATTPA